MAIRAARGADFAVMVKLPGDVGVPGGIDSADPGRITAFLLVPGTPDYVTLAQGRHAYWRA